MTSVECPDNSATPATAGICKNPYHEQYVDHIDDHGDLICASCVAFMAGFEAGDNKAWYGGFDCGYSRAMAEIAKSAADH